MLAQVRIMMHRADRDQDNRGTPIGLRHIAWNVPLSALTDVLGKLLYENRLGEEDLRGLREEKMKSIRSFAQFLRDGAA
jgi:hypothetical protein